MELDLKIQADSFFYSLQVLMSFGLAFVTAVEIKLTNQQKQSN